MSAAEAAAAQAKTDEDAARALRDLGAALWAAVFAGHEKGMDKRMQRAASPIWPAALRWYEQTVDALSADGAAIPALAEQLATIVLFPQDAKLSDALRARDWQGDRYSQLTGLAKRYVAARPWW